MCINCYYSGGGWIKRWKHRKEPGGEQSGVRNREKIRNLRAYKFFFFTPLCTYFGTLLVAYRQGCDYKVEENFSSWWRRPKSPSTPFSTARHHHQKTKKTRKSVRVRVYNLGERTPAQLFPLKKFFSWFFKGRAKGSNLWACFGVRFVTCFKKFSRHE